MVCEYECKYVYFDEKRQEFFTVNIHMSVDEVKSKMIIIIDLLEAKQAEENLEDIIKNFNISHCKRIKLNLFEECELYLRNNNQLSRIYINDKLEIIKTHRMERV